jgi:hypothetical protein
LHESSEPSQRHAGRTEPLFQLEIGLAQIREAQRRRTVLGHAARRREHQPHRSSELALGSEDALRVAPITTPAGDAAAKVSHLSPVELVDGGQPVLGVVLAEAGQSVDVPMPGQAPERSQQRERQQHEGLEATAHDAKR